MNKMSRFIELLNDNKVDEAIAYIEGNDFPPDTYEFDEAHKLRQLKSGVLMLLGDLRGIVEKMGSSQAEDEHLRSIKDALYVPLATYVDLRLLVVAHAIEEISLCDEEISLIDEAIEEIEEEKEEREKRRANRRNLTVKENIGPRDALIFAIARESGLPSMNKQADYTHEKWNDPDCDLAEFRRLSKDTIRKILRS